MLLSCHPGKLDVVVVCNEWIRTAKLATNTVVVGSFIILLCSTMMKGIAQYYTTKFLKNKIDKLPIIMVLVTNFAALSNEQLIRRRRNTCKVPLPLSRPSVWWTACCMHNCGWMVRWEEEEGNSCLDDGNQTVALSSGDAIQLRSCHHVARWNQYISPPGGNISCTDFTSPPGSDYSIE